MKLSLTHLRRLINEEIIDASDRFGVARVKANWRRARQAGYSRTRDERVEEIANLCGTVAIATIEREVEGQNEGGKTDIVVDESVLKEVHDRVTRIVKSALRYGR